MPDAVPAFQRAEPVRLTAVDRTSVNRIAPDQALRSRA